MSHNDYTRWFHTILEVSTVIIQLYSSVNKTIIIDMDDLCSSSHQDVYITLIVFTLFIGLIYFVFFYLYLMGTRKNPQGADGIRCESWSFTGLTLILAMFSLVLGDNNQPLGCRFGCNGMNMESTMVTNSMPTNNLVQCNLQGLSITSLVLSICSLLVTAVIFVVIIGE